MIRRVIFLLLVSLSCARTNAADLSTAPAEDLLKVYSQLRSLQGSAQGVVTDNLVFKRDAGTFTFTSGRITLAVPVEGHVLAAYFAGQGTFELNPPTAMDRQQIARYAKAPKLVDTFREAVFFFTDDSAEQLQKLAPAGSNGDAALAVKALADAQRQYAERCNDWWSNERNGNLRMRNLAARMLADLTDPTSRGFFLADFKGAKSGDLFFHVSWNRDPVFMPEIANSDEVMLVHANWNKYYEWWSGFHLAEEYAKSPHPDHRTLVAHCTRETIDLDLTEGHRIAASAEMDFEVVQGTPRLLPFNLRGVLRISGIEDAAGQKVAYIQEARDLDNDPWLILPEPAKTGTPYKVKISYAEDSTHDSRIINQKGSGLYYVTSRESWFPSFGAFDDRSDFVLNVRSPKKFTFVATGNAVSSEKGKDFLETQWKSQIPLGVVGFNYGDFVEKSQGDPRLKVTTYAGREVPDELKSIRASLDLADLAAGPGAGGGGGSATRAGIMTGGFNTAANAQYAANVSFQALKFDEFYFGPLPFQTVSVTEQPIRGYGQSWPTLIFLPYDSLLDSTTRHSLGLQNSGEAREFYNILAVHEMAHQWWGHLVGWKTYHDQWLSEGFAEFSASLFVRQFEPKQLDSYWSLKRKWLLSKNKVGHRPVDVGPIWLALQLPSYMEPDLYRVLVYDKGAYVLEMLRVLMWDANSKNPDAPFMAMMKDFVTTYSAKNASTEDFRRIVEKHMKEPMGWFLDEWVYGTEIPHYDFNYQLKDAGAGKTQLTIAVKQSEVSDSFRMRVPVEAVINGQLHRLGLLDITGARSLTQSVELPMRPEKVVLDGESSILCTISQ